MSLIVFCGAAHAQRSNLTTGSQGYLYFNRPGASLSEHNSELANCMSVWAGASAVSTASTSAHPLIPGIVDGAIADAINDRAVNAFERARRAVNIEHCMVARGWRVMRLEEQEGALASLDAATLATQLGGAIGAQDAPGLELRTWGNEGAKLDTMIFGSPRLPRQTLLSARLVLSTPMEAIKPVEVAQVSEYQPWHVRTPLTGSSVVPTALTAAAAPPPGFALLILGVTGSGSSPQYLFSVERSSRSQEAMQDYFHVQLHGARRDSSGRLSKTMTLLVPAGEWRVYGHRLQLDYCIGAPFFAAESGAVVFLGEFDFDSGVLNPNVSAEALQRHVPANSPITSVTRSAAWMNGATWPCRMELMYALEFAGYPYAPDYTWGGAASTGSAAPN